MTSQLAFSDPAFWNRAFTEAPDDPLG